MTVAEKTWTYWLPPVNGEGCAWIVIDSVGRFTTISDWGNYGYWWSPAKGSDFRKFLLRIDESYTVGKLGMQRGRVLHMTQTRHDIKAAICGRRREKTLTKERAAIEWDLVRELRDAHELHDWYNETELDGAGELPHYDYDQQVCMFVKHVMPRLRDAIRAELAAEATAGLTAGDPSP
ncbi:MAG: hypothetical protein H0U59_12905 [Gemmatimonadaceae bacterium]|nr:hypothetical protein [Gemmatimonadaceae bacterium]